MKHVCKLAVNRRNRKFGFSSVQSDQLPDWCSFTTDSTTLSNQNDPVPKWRNNENNVSENDPGGLFGGYVRDQWDVGEVTPWEKLFKELEWKQNKSRWRLSTSCTQSTLQLTNHLEWFFSDELQDTSDNFYTRTISSPWVRTYSIYLINNMSSLSQPLSDKFCFLILIRLLKCRICQERIEQDTRSKNMGFVYRRTLPLAG